MSLLENCFDTMLEYGESIKSSFVKGHKSDWPEKEEAGEEAGEEASVVSEIGDEVIDPVEYVEPTDPESIPEVE